MISLRDLVAALARRNLAAWSVVERVQDLAIVDEPRDLHRREHRTRLTVIVHQDVPRGRGSARLDFDAYDGSADELVDHTVALALAAVGPAWLSPPPAAPAKVALADDDLRKRDLDAVALATLARLRRPPGIALAAAATAMRERLAVVASSGFHTTWLATSLRAEAHLALDPAALAAPAAAADSSAPPPLPAPRPSSSATSATPSSAATPTDRTAGPASAAATASSASTSHRLAASFHVARHARRIDDLAFDAAISDAAADLAHLADATAPPTGPCALWLGADALLAPAWPDDRGPFAIFAHHADAAIQRQGLTRYRHRAEIAPGAAQLAEPLTITSLGALDFATASAPVSDDAVAVRDFPLVERGIATGLGLSPREAALRRTEPNGGIRNLDISLGSWPATAAALTAPTVELRRLRAVSLDLATGDATLDIALGFDHRPGRAPVPFTGGTVHLDLIAALARARRSSQLLRRAGYHGPAALLIENAELIA